MAIGNIDISLTGEKSHSIHIPRGQGSFSIGAIGMDVKNFNVLVDKSLPINWNAFNRFIEEGHTYGHWPRIFNYSGNDTGFIKWSEKRRIEQFNWSPLDPVSADLTQAYIDTLVIYSKHGKVELHLGDNMTLLGLYENLNDISIIEVMKIPTLVNFSPYTTKDTMKPYKLPIFSPLKEVISIDINVNPLGQPFDCESLLQFQQIEKLNLSGNITNLQSLKHLIHLKSIGLRYVPNLEGMLPLTTWDKLESFIAWNIEETIGKELKKELKQLEKTKELEYSSVSQLRKPVWFITEYGIPFSSWESKNEKKAIKAYKSAIKELKKATTLDDVKDIILKFSKLFNDFPRIETSEREDIFEAVLQLIQIPKISIDEEKAVNWFDLVRDY